MKKVDRRLLLSVVVVFVLASLTAFWRLSWDGAPGRSLSSRQSARGQTSEVSTQGQGERLDRASPVDQPSAKLIRETPEAGTASGVSPRALRLIGEERTLRGGIMRARQMLGEGNRELQDIEFSARVACKGDPDPHGTTDPKNGMDPLRGWAIARLAELCDGVEAIPLASHIDPGQRPDMTKALEKHDVVTAIQSAKAALGQSTEFSELAEAGLVLYDQGKLPMEEIFGHDVSLGKKDVMDGWATAANLALCNEAGGCSPDSLETVRLCARAGCTPGSTYESALQQSLSPREYQTVMAFYRWLMSQRGTPGHP